MKNKLKYTKLTQADWDEHSFWVLTSSKEYGSTSKFVELMQRFEKIFGDNDEPQRLSN